MSWKDSIQTISEEPSKEQKVASWKDSIQEIPEGESFDSNRSVNSLSSTDANVLMDELQKSIDDKTQQPQIGGLEATAKGLTEGITYNTFGEIAAPFMAAAGMVGGAINPEQKIPNLPGEEGLAGTLEKFKRLTQLASETNREAEVAAEEQHPLKYGTAKFAGGVLAPGLGAAKAFNAVKNAGLATKAAVGAGVGAATGGLSAFGESERSISERLPETLEGMQTGALVGGAIPVAGAALGKIADGAKGIFRTFGGKPIEEGFDVGRQGFNINEPGAKTGEFEKMYGKAKNLIDDINTLFKQTNTRIGQALKDSKGKTVDLKEELTDTFEQLKNMRQTEETAKYAQDIESELNYILGIKKASVEDLSGAPTGLLPKATDALDEVDLSKITPQQAQDIKQVMYRYSLDANQNLTAQQKPPAIIAGKTSSESRKKLATMSDDLAQANDQYAALSNTVERLKIKENQLPQEQVAQVSQLLTNLEKGNIKAFEVQQIMNDVVENIKKVNPKLAEEYRQGFNEIAKRIDLLNQLTGGTAYTKAGAIKRVAMSAGNIAGLGVNKLESMVDVPLNAIKKPFEAITEKYPALKLDEPLLTAANLKKAATISPDIREGAEGPTASSMRIAQSLPKVGQYMPEPIKGQEYHKRNRRLANAAENANPEILTAQAQQVRSQYGQQGEQLAITLTNMAEKDKDARRALMWSVLQSPANRKMLGMMDEE